MLEGACPASRPAELPLSPLPPPHLQVYAGHWSGIQVAVKVLITRESFEAEVEGEGLQLPESVQVRRCPALPCHARCLDGGCDGSPLTCECRNRPACPRNTPDGTDVVNQVGPPY